MKDFILWLGATLMFALLLYLLVVGFTIDIAPFAICFVFFGAMFAPMLIKGKK